MTAPQASMQEAIVALATPVGTSALAIIRLSGKDTIKMTNQVFLGDDLTKQKTHTIHFGTIHDQGAPIDEVLVSVFIAPYSFTKEDSIEINCHGSPFIIDRIIELFLKQGARMAQPGEFTKRAFLNGRFDLTQAESVAELIAANSSRAHQAALCQMRGGFSSKLEELHNQLKQFLVLLEVELDFSEEDTPTLSVQQLRHLALELIDQLDDLTDNFRFNNAIKQGLSVALIGEPNAGKSTLLNQILGEERAIVSPIAGTTRDFIEGQLHLGGLLFRFTDTAGLKESTTDQIEAIGISRTKQIINTTDLILYVVDMASASLDQAEKALNQLDSPHALMLKIANKADLATVSAKNRFEQAGYLVISAHIHTDIDNLKGSILELVKQQQTNTSCNIMINMRHFEGLSLCKQSIKDAITCIDQNLPAELLAVDIRKAIYALGTITGQVTTEEILDDIFSKFCIGK